MATYWQQFNLSLDPFMSENNNEVAYKSPRYEQQLDLLVHLANNESKIQLVTGLTGIGKSTMMHQMLKELTDVSGICKVHGGATIVPDVLQELIARHLGLKFDLQQKEFDSNALKSKITNMRAQEKNFFLVIDNAHKLPKSSLAFLIEIMKWQINEHPVIHIILFGGPQLEATFAELTATAMGEHLTHTIRLEALNEEEIKAYITHRLALAGYENNCPFTENEMQKIIQISRGIPSKINYIAKQMMLQKIQRNKPSKKKKFKKSSKMKTFKQLIFSVAGLMVAFILFEEYQGYTPVGKQTANAQVLKIHAEPMTTQKAQSLSTSMNQMQTKVEGVSSAKSQWPDYMKQNNTMERQQSQANVKTIASAADSKTMIKHQENAINTTEIKQPQKTALATIKTKEKPANTVKSSVKTAPKIMPKTQKGVTASQHEKETKSPYTKDEKLLLTKSQYHYAIQLAGSHDLNYLESNFKSLALSGSVHYFKTALNGKPWYVVIYGDYSDKKSARTAIAQLPADLQNTHPWPRSYGSIHKAIKAAS